MNKQNDVISFDEFAETVEQWYHTTANSRNLKSTSCNPILCHQCPFLELCKLEDYKRNPAAEKKFPGIVFDNTRREYEVYAYAKAHTRKQKLKDNLKLI